MEESHGAQHSGRLPGVRGGAASCPPPSKPLSHVQVTSRPARSHQVLFQLPHRQGVILWLDVGAGGPSLGLVPVSSCRVHRARTPRGPGSGLPALWLWWGREKPPEAEGEMCVRRAPRCDARETLVPSPWRVSLPFLLQGRGLQRGRGGAVMAAGEGGGLGGTMEPVPDSRDSGLQRHTRKSSWTPRCVKSRSLRIQEHVCGPDGDCRWPMPLLPRGSPATARLAW